MSACAGSGRISLATAFKAWDAQHNLYLSRVCYAPEQASDALFPLLLALIAAVGTQGCHPGLGRAAALAG